MMSIMLILSFTFLFLNHPMTMGLTLLIQTITIALITGFMNLNFWFSYILFLIMVGGLLVIFIYMTSIASNEMFSYNSKLLLINFSFFFMIMLMLNMDNTLINYSFNFTENFINNKFLLNINKFFNYPSIYIIFIIIIYLFITLIAVVKITKIEYGPLRQMF
uniref:NADH-ubiquinone oxidoreductase chain 6 n=1 Tax=Staphylinidae sp. BMNH 1274255 TaxID=1796575 RepID=A0A126TEX3_9COLE|nr:NADH dehydrogenase subunit 6 [Staphylinidae sp. BMNH 1274255]